LTFADFTKTSEADIEELFDVSFYLELVNNEYKDQLSTPVTEAVLPKHPRIVERLEKYFGSNPVKSGTFNHYRPARYFAEHIGEHEPRLSPATMDRFEAASKALNALIK
jgi:hypothetical protein